MRHLTIALIALTFFALTACGGGGSGRQTEQKLSLEQAPTATNPEGLKASITYYKQTEKYLIVKISLTNESKESITLKNGEGTTLPGFRATVEGQTFIADQKGGGGGWNPWTGYRAPTGGGSNNLEIPAGITAAIEVRWNFSMSRKDYDWVATITNIQSGEKKLTDIAFAWPPKAAPVAAPAAAPAATK